jgi:hypothetical protein
MVLKIGHCGKYNRNSWRRMKKISWTNRVRNEEVLQRVKKERHTLQIIKRRKTNSHHA